MSLNHGTQQVFDDWQQSGKANPTTKDLTKESILQSQQYRKSDLIAADLQRGTLNNR